MNLLQSDANQAKNLPDFAARQPENGVLFKGKILTHIILVRIMCVNSIINRYHYTIKTPDYTIIIQL